MRIAPVALWLMIIALFGAAIVLPGCTSEEETAAVNEEAPALDEHGHPVGTHDEEPPAPDSAEMPDAVTPEQAEAALSQEADLNRAYGQADISPLATVLRIGTDEQKQKARETLQRLLLQSTVVETRVAAASSLGMDPNSVGALSQAVMNDPQKPVRHAAISSLMSAEATPEVLAALQRAQAAPDPEIRAAALTGEMEVRLNSYKPGDDLAWIVRLLDRRRDDASAQMQMRLVQRGAPILPAAINVLRTGPSAQARAAAATAIMFICAGTHPKQEQFAELSRANIEKEGLEKPQPANLDGLKPLEDALANDPAWEVRAVAAQGLAYLGQESSAPLLGDALSDEREEVRWWAALGLETVPSEAALTDLSNAVRRDESERVRAAAVRSLGWSGSESAIKPLILATGDASAAVRQVAAQELARFKSEVSLQALVQLFDDQDEDVRWAAVVAAGELRDEETVPALIEAMRDPSPMVANAAERALQRMGRAEQRFGFESET